MANTIAIDSTHRTSPKHDQIGLAKLTVVSTETYATATAGFSVDMTAPLLALGVAFADIIHVTGTPTLTGHMPVFTKTATAGTFTVRLYSGATEIADGALTQTVTALVWYSPGART